MQMEDNGNIFSSLRLSKDAIYGITDRCLLL